ADRSVRSTVVPRACSGRWDRALSTLDCRRDTTIGMAPRSAAADATPRPMPEVPPMTRTRAFFKLIQPLSAGFGESSKTFLVANRYPMGMVAPDLDMRKLRYFVAVAEELNFGRAAERLHIAQPVLARQIRSFESDLGVQLFARDSRGTQLTAAGKQLLED